MKNEDGENENWSFGAKENTKKKQKRTQSVQEEDFLHSAKKRRMIQKMVPQKNRKKNCEKKSKTSR